MHIEKEASTPTVKPRRRWIGRIVRACIILALIVGSIGLSLLTNQPRWRTLTGEAKPGDWAATVDCPDTWQIENPYKGRQTPGFSLLTLRRKPPTGLMGWWNKVVLHQNPNTIYEPRFIAYAFTNSSFGYAPPSRSRKPVGKPGSGDSYRKQEAEAQVFAYQQSCNKFMVGFNSSFRNMKVQRIQNPVGPAMMMEYDLTSPLPRKQVNGAAFVPLHMIQMYIVSDKTAFEGTLMVSYNFPLREQSHLQPLLNRMASSVRLVKK